MPMEHLLPLADHPQKAVVYDGYLDGELVHDGRRQVLRDHLETAVAVDHPHGRVRLAELRPERRGQPEAHRP